MGNFRKMLLRKINEARDRGEEERAERLEGYLCHVDKASGEEAS
jgi:uncharacterized protein YpiB (UPF0302 family)